MTFHQPALMLPADTFSGRRIIITGGGTGLGRSMTEGLFALGANLVICGRRPDVLQKAAEEIAAGRLCNGPTPATGTACGAVFARPCDVRDPAQVEALLDAAVERFGAVHALVNNAAGNFICPTERLSYNAFNTIIDIVLRGTANCTLALGKRWIAAKQPGNILNIVATYAWTGSGYVVPSAAAKAGVLALTQSLACEWGRHRIRLNAIAPGPFPTEGAWSRLIPPPVEKLLDPARTVPLSRVGEHEELVNLACYLLSDYSAYVNGECVVIDGGQWLHGAGMFNALDALSETDWDAIQAATKPRKSP